MGLERLVAIKVDGNWKDQKILWAIKRERATKGMRLG